MRVWVIRFVSGRSERIEGFRLCKQDDELKIRTSHDSAYAERWVSFPLANVESYREI